jgi:hypothetical protein
MKILAKNNNLEIAFASLEGEGGANFLNRRVS